MDLNLLFQKTNALKGDRWFGEVTSLIGLRLEIGGLQSVLSVGDHARIYSKTKGWIRVEIVGFRNEKAIAMGFSDLQGITIGSRVELLPYLPQIIPTEEWKGRIINALGEPVDDLGYLPQGQKIYPVYNRPPLASRRTRLGGKLDLGVRAVNTFLTCCEGQRLGIFSGSGVGKSTLLSMMARYTTADVVIIGLVGERGRELKEFLEDDLGEEGRKKSVVVVATSDESPLMRKQAAHMTLAVAEYFRDEGLQVLCLMDSVTRFAMAQREIGLSAGEVPTTKGYTPSVFEELPKLLERAGPGVDQGKITGLFTVLVEGDDTNEPISDAVRGILDGHIILSRAIAERGRFPAIDILKSISRTMPNCNTDDQNTLIRKARQVLSTYEDMAELIRLGAYRIGANPEVDQAINLYPLLEDFLAQLKAQNVSLEQGYSHLDEILTS
jgi:flagellum-specific ATP synthase